MKGVISFEWWAEGKRYEVAARRQPPGVVAVAAWLRADIETNVSTLDFWIERFNDVAAGKEKGGYLGTGNAFSVMAVGEDIYLECEFSESQKVFLTRSQLMPVLMKYRVFLEGDIDNPDRVPEPITVEYEAEGEEALARYERTGGSMGVGPDEMTS